VETVVDRVKGKRAYARFVLDDGARQAKFLKKLGGALAIFVLLESQLTHLKVSTLGHNAIQEKAWGTLEAAYKNALNDALTTGKITFNRGMDLVGGLEAYLRALEEPDAAIAAIVTPLYHAVAEFPVE
jgi:hypothetical protein